MAAAVLLPAGLVALHAEGLLFAETDGAEAAGRNAQRNEVLLDGGGAAIAEAQVVFRRTTFVAMALDGHLESRIVFKEIRGLRECRASVGANVGPVVVEISVAHFSQEEFIVRGPRWRRRRRRRIDRDSCSGTGGAAGTGRGNRVGRRVRWRDFGGALSSHGTDFGLDGELRSIGGIPA